MLAAAAFLLYRSLHLANVPIASPENLYSDYCDLYAKKCDLNFQLITFEYICCHFKGNFLNVTIRADAKGTDAVFMQFQSSRIHKF